jgi:nucleoside-diphosphate-sugar epimerase
MHKPEQLTILITGATDGLGQRVAADLAAKGVTLLKGRRVLAKIREISGNSRLYYSMPTWLPSMRSIVWPLLLATASRDWTY